MAKRFSKPSINWAEMEKKVPQEQKVNFLAFKGKADAYFRRVVANPPEPPKINWEEYQKMVPVQGLVEKFKKEYEALKVPFPTDTLTAKVDEQWGQLQPEIKAFCAEMQKNIDEANKELARIKSLPKLQNITMEMFPDLYPDQGMDFVKNPSFWPHTPEEQPGFVHPLAGGGHH